MAKRPRKKSPNTRSGDAVRVRSPKSLKTTPAPKARSASSNKARRLTGGAAPAASPKTPSKPLVSRQKPTTTVAKPAAGNSPARNPPSGTTKASAASALNEGSRAPDFRLPRDGNGTVSLSDFAGKNLVIFFYPRANTPGCTREAIDFTRLSSAFAKNQTALLGVSADPQKAQEAFRNKHQLAMPLASDERHEMLAAYGVWAEKSMYGKTFYGILRTTVWIGPDRRVMRIWRNVKVDGHADEVLAAIRSEPS